jgi:hypothetical protein
VKGKLEIVPGRCNDLVPFANRIPLASKDGSTPTGF